RVMDPGPGRGATLHLHVLVDAFEGLLLAAHLQACGLLQLLEVHAVVIDLRMAGAVVAGGLVAAVVLAGLGDTEALDLPGGSLRRQGGAGDGGGERRGDSKGGKGKLAHLRSPYGKGCSRTLRPKHSRLSDG